MTTTILGIVINNGVVDQVCYSAEYKSLKDILEILNQVDTAVLVFNNGNNSYFLLDLKKLFSVQEYLSFENWEELHVFIERQESDWLAMYAGSAVVPSHMQITDNKWIPCPFGSFTNNQIKVVSFENGDYGKVELGNAGTPYYRDNKRSFPYTKDAVFSDLKDIDIDNSIPIIHGCAFKPSVWVNPVTKKKEMFALQAGRLISYAKWNQKRTKTAPHIIARDENNNLVDNHYKGNEVPVPRSYYYNEGIMMIDFSNVGTISIVDSSEFKDVRLSRIDISTINKERTNLTQGDNYSFDPHDWMRGEIPVADATSFKLEFLLPETEQDGIPIVCLFGRLLFVQEYVAMHKTSNGLHISVVLPKDLLERILLSNMQNYGKHIADTTNIQLLLEIALENLFTNNKENYISPSLEELHIRKYADFQKPFVIMLHTNKRMLITRIKPKMSILPDKLVFPANSGGILVNMKTYEIIDYVRVNYKHDTLVTCAMQCPLNMVNDLDPHRLDHPQLGYERYKCDHEPEFFKYDELSRKLRTPDCFELMDISYLIGNAEQDNIPVEHDSEEEATPSDKEPKGVIEYDRAIKDWVRPVIEQADNPETPEEDIQTIIWPNRESTDN